MVLCDLGKLGEQSKGEGGYLEERDCFLGEVSQRCDQDDRGNGCASNLGQVAGS